MYKQKGCCLTSLFLLPFKIMWLFAKPFLYIVGALVLFTCAITFASIPLILLGCIYLIFAVIRWVFKKKLQSSTKPEESKENLDSATSNDTLIGMESMYLHWAKEAAETVNTTYSPLQFWNSLDEVISCLKKLSEKEAECPSIFTVSPSKNLDQINENIVQTQLDFINRSHKKDVFWKEISMVKNRFDSECIKLIDKFREETSSRSDKHFSYSNHLDKIRKEEKKRQDLERFMIECNAYLDHQDEMEQYIDILNDNNTEQEPNTDK